MRYTGYMSDITIPVAPRDLVDELIARGEHWVSLRDVANLLSIPDAQAPAIMSRLRVKNKVFSPTRGAYVPVPPEFRSWGAVPASHFIDPLMKQLGHYYYVGLLSAAEIHGAAHQKPQVFQVVTNARVRNRAFGRVKIEFIYDRKAPVRPTNIVNTPTGTMHVATSEVTLLDLVYRPNRSGGLSNITTVASEMLSERKLEIDRIVKAAVSYPVATVKRTGWILDQASRLMGIEIETEPLVKLSSQRSEPTPLDCRHPRAGVLDKRWNVLVNTEIEPDV